MISDQTSRGEALVTDFYFCSSSYYSLVYDSLSMHLAFALYAKHNH